VKSVVAYKWARDPEDAAVRSDGTVDWRGAKMTAGDDDPAAIAVATTLAAGAGATLVGLTIGDGDATWALARGIESAVSVPDAPFLADNAATAGILAAAVRSIGDVDLVVIGDAEAYPGVAAAIAGILGWPALLGVSEAAFADGRVVAVRRMGASEQTVDIGLPAVIGAVSASAEKQAPGMKEVLAARRRPVTAIPLATLGLAALDRVRSRATSVPETGTARIFDGDAAASATQLVAALRADGVL